MKRLLLCLLCSLAIVTLAGAGHASLRPPPTGDWTIEEGETATVAGEYLTVPGSVYVAGTLIITDSVLRLPPGRVLNTNFGELQVTRSTITSTTASPVYFYADRDGRSTFVDCVFDPVSTVLVDSSRNTFTNCTFRAMPVVTGYFADSTFTDCVFDGISFSAPSVSRLTGCRLNGTNPDDARGRVTFQIEDGPWWPPTRVDLVGLQPGSQAATVIQASTNGYRVELNNTTVASFGVVAYNQPSVRIERSNIRYLMCKDHDQIDVINSEVGEFWVGMANWGYFGPINLVVRDFYDDGRTFSSDILSTNSAFRVSFRDSKITKWSAFVLGDNGGPTGSSNVIENSVMDAAYSAEHSSLQTVNSTFNNLGVFGECAMPTASIAAEHCSIETLRLTGSATSATLRFSRASNFIFSDYPSPGVSSPTLTFESSKLGSWGTGGWGGLQVAGLVNGAHISGTVQVDPSEWIYQWTLGSAIIRSFPVLVKRPDGQPVAGALVEVIHPPDPCVPPDPCIWTGVTDEYGFAYPEVTFDDTNNALEFTVSAAQGGASESAPLTFLSSTPVELVLPIVYQIQWVPPLHDGTSVEAPDGPFKQGRTIPVKFRLLDADGQLVPDEQAEALAATLQVFYEMPSDRGTPTDPGDAPPDVGSEFRYVAEDDLFIYNLSTKDPAWIADYTYGLEVLIDGARVGEVFFSLR